MPRLGEKRPPVRDRDERDQIVTKNLRLSFFAVRLWAGQFGLDAEDACAECHLALIKAASLWRPDQGRTFAGYAVKAMFNHLVNFARKERRVACVQSLVEGWERQADPKEYDPVEVVNNRTELVRLRDAIARLDPRSRQVMQARVAGEGTRVIAERLGVTRQRIEQIEQQARSRLRESASRRLILPSDQQSPRMLRFTADGRGEQTFRAKHFKLSRRSVHIIARAPSDVFAWRSDCTNSILVIAPPSRYKTVVRPVTDR